MMHAYPMLLEPILKPRVWGGGELARFGKAISEGGAIGESWEVADLDGADGEACSVVTNGPWAERTLHEIIEQDRALLMGLAPLWEATRFPLLIKYLDARQNLSVQVHPTLEYTQEHPEAHLKSEAWVVVDAVPGAVIYKGVRVGVTPAAFATAIRNDTVAEMLDAVPVSTGDCHFLPSGTCHALGAGIIVAEVQTPSDTTFRVYDWGRDGRELHVEQALACIDFSEPREQARPRLPLVVDGLVTTTLAETSFFTIERLDARADTGLQLVTDESPVVWMCLGGGGAFRGGGVEVAVDPGRTVLVPAALEDGTCRMDAGSTLLRISLPPVTKGMLA